VSHSVGTDAGRLSGIKTLQDLYGILWDEVVLQPLIEGPAAPLRVRALRVLTGEMDRLQRTAVPREVFSGPEHELNAAAEWLASAGILIQGPQDWTLLHQTFFDYCYARFFVEDHRTLAPHVLQSDQGLFARPQLVQVLSFLRGTNNLAYLSALSDLLAAEGLRVHLRELLLRWFGVLQDTTEEEWVVARRLLVNPATRHRLLSAMSGNRGWFLRVRTGPLTAWLKADAARIDEEVLPYLASLVDSSQAEIAELATPWLDWGQDWLARLRYLFWRVRHWHAPGMIDLFQKYLGTRHLTELGDTDAIDDIAKDFPVDGAQLLRTVFEAALDAFMERGRFDEIVQFRGITEELELLNGYAVTRAIQFTIDGDPRAFLEAMLPWLERAVSSLDPVPQTLRKSYFPGDPLSWGLTHGQVHKALTAGYVRALAQIAVEDAPGFFMITGRMAALEHTTPQRLIARVYRELTPRLTSEACRFLLGDPRRLTLGEDTAYDTRKLIEAIASYLTAEEINHLENFVVTHSGHIERLYGDTYDLRRRGKDLLFLLQSFPRDRLTEGGRCKLEELERKFPGEVAVHRPRSTIAHLIGPPIAADAGLKMSDEGWLGAMATYAHGVEHRSHKLGGARQLASLLKTRVQEEPDRFGALAMRTSAELDEAYAEAFLDGLAESTAPRNLLFDVIRHFAPHAGPGLRRWIAWILERLAVGEVCIPSDLIERLEEWLFTATDEDETEADHSSELVLQGAINTERGAILHALMRALSLEDGEKPLESRWAWMEYAAADPSLLFRAGALAELVYLIEEDKTRAIALLEKLSRGMPRLREFHSFHEVLYWGSFGCFERLAPYVEEVMRSEPPQARTRGAELAVIAQISTRGLESDAARSAAERLAEEVVTGELEWRKGAARIYSHNLVDGPADLCVHGLRRLLNDEDEAVRREVVWFVHQLREEHLFSLQNFLEEFAASRSYREDVHSFEEFLWQHGLLDPAWALNVVEITLDNSHPAKPYGGRGAEELVRLVLRIYTDPTGDALRRERAMDMFDRLMEVHSGYAWQALDEWDRR
jgi:hypothetical protein